MIPEIEKEKLDANLEIALLALETAVLRIMFNSDKKKFKKLASNEIKESVERELQPASESLFKRYSMLEIIEFTKKFYAEENDVIS